jgi:DNA-binding transcriptional LysR family regulator
MELRHLRYFVAVAEELHFRRAAERLHVAQPAVSEQVRKLEEELGVRLFERSPRHVSLTDAGAVLLNEARRVLRQAEAAQSAVRSAHARHGGVLRIGYMPISLPAGIPRALQRLTVAIPHLQATMQPGSSSDLVAALRDGEIDAAIVSLPAPAPGLHVTPLGEQHAVAVLPIAHRLALASSVRLDQVAPERVVILPRDVDRPLYDAVLAACRAAGLSPALLEIPGGQIERLLLAVASGAGMALLPECIAERYGTAGIRFVPVADAGHVLATAALTRRGTEHVPTLAFIAALGRLHPAAPGTRPPTAVRPVAA